MKLTDEQRREMLLALWSDRDRGSVGHDFLVEESEVSSILDDARTPRNGESCFWAYIRCGSRSAAEACRSSNAFDRDWYTVLEAERDGFHWIVAGIPTRTLDDLSYAIDDVAYDLYESDHIYPNDCLYVGFEIATSPTWSMKIDDE